MKSTFRQSMSGLHTWAGLTLSWLLYFMFLTGTFGYFDEEIDQWMQPEVPVARDIPQAQLLATAEQRLKIVAPDASTWRVDFPVGRYPYLAISWQGTAAQDINGVDEWHEEKLDPHTGQAIAARATGGGQVLYRMHYALHYMPRSLALWLSSLAAMFLFVSLLTGMVIHKKIFKDFFTFRPGKQQRSWLDMHNIFSVLPLPFHLMITYSGLILLMFTNMPGILSANYGLSDVQQDRFFAEMFAEREYPEAVGIAANTLAPSALLPTVEKQWGEGRIAYFGLEKRGDLNGHIEVGLTRGEGLSEGPRYIYNAVSGDLQHNNESAKTDSKALAFYDAMIGLHEGLFAGIALRCLYFLSGLMGAAMVATGAIYWAKKRRENVAREAVEPQGLALIEALNAGAIVGLPIAIAVYFWANRLIPLHLDGRADWEVHSLFIAWGLTLLYSFCRPTAVGASLCIWLELLLLAALLYGLLPLLNAVTTSRHLGRSIVEGDWVMVGFDMAMLLFALLFCGAAIVLLHRKDTPDSAGVSRTKAGLASGYKADFSKCG